MYQPLCSHGYGLPITVFLLLRGALNTRFCVCGRWQTTTLPLLLLPLSSGVSFCICFLPDWPRELCGPIDGGRNDCVVSGPGFQDLGASAPALWEPCCLMDKPELGCWRVSHHGERRQTVPAEALRDQPAHSRLSLTFQPQLSHQSTAEVRQSGPEPGARSHPINPQNQEK